MRWVLIYCTLYISQLESVVELAWGPATHVTHLVWFNSSLQVLDPLVSLSSRSTGETLCAWGCCYLKKHTHVHINTCQKIMFTVTCQSIPVALLNTFVLYLYVHMQNILFLLFNITGYFGVDSWHVILIKSNSVPGWNRKIWKSPRG